MKKLLALAALAAAFSFSAQAQWNVPRRDTDRVPAAKSSFPVHALKYLGRHAKETITDTKHKEWAAMVIVTVAAFAADDATTCRAFSNVGGIESNPLYFHTRSCAKLTVLGGGYTFANLMLMHIWHEAAIDFCAQDPLGSSLYEKHPEGCGHSMWIAASPGLIQRGMAAYCNAEYGCVGHFKNSPHPPSMVNRQ